jgi:hypothetical protein
MCPSTDRSDEIRAEVLHERIKNAITLIEAGMHDDKDVLDTLRGKVTLPDPKSTIGFKFASALLDLKSFCVSRIHTVHDENMKSAYRDINVLVQQHLNILKMHLLLDTPPKHRWNFEERADGIYFCSGDHDRSENCDYIKLTIPVLREWLKD